MEGFCWWLCFLFTASRVWLGYWFWRGQSFHGYYWKFAIVPQDEWGHLLVPDRNLKLSHLDLLRRPIVQWWTVAISGAKLRAGIKSIVRIEVGGGKYAPSAPFPDSSWWTSAEDSNGINSAIMMGWAAILSRIHRKSFKACWTHFFKEMQVPILAGKAFWSWLKRFWDPGRAMDI